MREDRAELIKDFGEWMTFVKDLEDHSEHIWNQRVAEGKWPVREIVAHIALWDDYFYEHAVAKVREGLPLTVKHLDYDEFNRHAKQRGQTATVQELTEHAVSSRRRIIETLSVLTVWQYEAGYTDADGHPFEVAQYIKDFIWHDRHHIRQINNCLNRRIEELSLNGWPALQTVVYDGWLLRFAEGYTKRSNSVSAIYGHTMEQDGKIEACERLYERRGLRPVFKITPFCQPESLDAELEARGYAAIDHSLVKTLRLGDIETPEDGDFRLERELSEQWLDVFTSFSRLTEEQRSVTRKMMEQSPLVKGFAVLYDNGVPAACGIAVIENGWIGFYDIFTDPDKRNRGFGRQLVLQLLNWGKSMGARQAYLLVVKDNAPANRLYDKIGFKTAYEYWYRAGRQK